MRFWKYGVWVLGVLVLIGAVIKIRSLSFAPPRPFEYGISFSAEYARFLGLEPRAVFSRMLAEIKPQYVRLAVPWADIEPQSGAFTFDDLDWYMRQAQSSSVRMTLAIGQKTPRWPECHTPAWATTVSSTRYAEVFSRYITAVVERYREHPALEFWQIENEPYVNFGDCPQFDRNLITPTVTQVRQLDPYHPILATDSGELSTWRKAAHLGDYFGTTLYRVVWNPVLGYVKYDAFLPPALYRLRAWLNGIDPNRAMIAELQAEPWIPNGSVLSTTVAEQFRSMNPEQFRKNLAVAERVGFPRIYLWGVEWWYWLDEKAADPSMLKLVQELLYSK